MLRQNWQHKVMLTYKLTFDWKDSFHVYRLWAVVVVQWSLYCQYLAKFYWNSSFSSISLHTFDALNRYDQILFGYVKWIRFIMSFFADNDRLFVDNLTVNSDVEFEWKWRRYFNLKQTLVFRLKNWSTFFKELSECPQPN